MQNSYSHEISDESQLRDLTRVEMLPRNIFILFDLIQKRVKFNALRKIQFINYFV